MPQLLIVAGPNGAGKSTLVRTGALSDWIDPPFEALNPDEIALEVAAELPSLAGDSLSIEAVRRSDARLDRCIEESRSVIVETVLSTDKLKERLVRARDNGFSVGLIYVTLRQVELSIGRVAQRVAMGGHDVPETRIRSRWTRSHENLAWFASQADLTLIFDNSRVGTPELIASKSEDEWSVFLRGRLPVVEALLAL